MNILNIEEFFYSRASDRVRKKVEASGLKHYQIYKPDHKQISRIINNERTKNNRYLICDAVLSNTYKDKNNPNKYIPCGLLKTAQLGFNSEKEILWGTDSEISEYLFDLFKILWEESLEDPTRYNMDVEIYLCDYIPYAKYLTYFDILYYSGNKHAAILYGIFEDDIINNIDDSREKAFNLFYEKCKMQFYIAFLNFAQTHSSFHKIDKTIYNELIPLFMSILENNKPDSTSLGVRVMNLIYADLSHSAEMIDKNIQDDYKKSLVNASSDYIIKLEKVQNNMLNKKWS